MPILSGFEAVQAQPDQRRGAQVGKHYLPPKAQDPDVFRVTVYPDDKTPGGRQGQQEGDQ